MSPQRQSIHDRGPRLLDLDLPSPAEQLAADEALLDWRETQPGGPGDEILMFWEPREIFAVAGYANKAAAEINLPACAARGVPAFRRCSGGGAVVQMPGGLNYSLILRIAETAPTRNITAANKFIMETNCAAIQGVVGPGKVVSVRGHTDLAIGAAGDSPEAPLKFAGNSQRRRKNFLLFHGTFLLNCDLRLIEELLPMPSLQPDYRAGRPHPEFVTNLRIPAAAVKSALAAAWNAGGALANPPWDAIARLARDKYSTPGWNHKF